MVLEALLDHRIVADVQHVSAARLDQQTGPIDKSVPQRLDGLKRPDRSPFAIRGTPLRCAGLHGPHQVERDNAEHLPGAVSVIALCWQAIEREAALELTVDLLVGAPSAHEVPQRPSGHFLVGNDGRVFVVPVVRIKQIQLIVLCRQVTHTLAVHHDTHHA